MLYINIFFQLPIDFYLVFLYDIWVGVNKKLNITVRCIKQRVGFIGFNLDKQIEILYTYNW